MKPGYGFAAALAALLLLGACATEYGPEQLTGGFAQTEVQPGVFHVAFAGNGYTTKETVQTYWLYRCAQLTLDQGYDGFQIITPIDLTAVFPPAADQAQIYLAHGGGGGAHYVYVPIYGGAYTDVVKPSIQGDIRLLKRPFTPAPPKSFDALALSEALAAHVTGEKCNGNVCPHVHDYLYPSARPAA